MRCEVPCGNLIANQLAGWDYHRHPALGAETDPDSWRGTQYGTYIHFAPQAASVEVEVLKKASAVWYGPESGLQVNIRGGNPRSSSGSNYGCGRLYSVGQVLREVY
jgi:hypothetical protein